MTDDERASTLDACGRAIGALLAFMADRATSGGPATADDIGEFAEKLIYDGPEYGPAISPDVQSVLKGVVEGLSVALDGSSDATL